MKIFRVLLLTLFSIYSCQSESPKTATAASAEEEKIMDSEKTLVVPWSVQLNDTSQKLEIKRDPAADMANLQPADIVDALNIKYPETKLKWEKMEDGRAIVSIMDATFLTQRSGTLGARAYLAEATYSLTEIKSIADVEFIFNEGDHARPGIYKRADFSF